jgi:hypothetical protein
MTNLREAQAYRLFDMLDIDQSGICMLWRTRFLVHVYVAHPEQPTDNRDQGRSGKGIPLQALASTSGISAVAIQD